MFFISTVEAAWSDFGYSKCYYPCELPSVLIAISLFACSSKVYSMIPMHPSNSETTVSLLMI